MKQALRSPWASAAVVVATVALSTAVATWLDRHVSLTVLAMVYLMAVSAVSYRLSLVASSATAVLAVLALNFFFVPPRGTFNVSAPEHLITLLALLLVALMVSSLSARLWAMAERAQQREQRARRLQQLAARLAALDDEAGILVSARASLVEAYGEPVPIVSRDAQGRAVLVGPEAGPLQPGDAVHDALAHCLAQRQVLGPGTGRWNDLPAWYFPLCAGDQTLGAFGVNAVPAADEARDHAQAIADLLAGALQRARHAAAAAAARGEAQSQQLRSELLASVAHDFRTPLASIIGAVSSLQQQHDRLPEVERLRLLALIDDEARHLSAMTDNTLQWARLSAPQPVIRRDWESIEEVVGSVLARVRRRDPSRRVQAQIPPGLPLVQADAVLLAQLVENLLDNALKYSDGPVQLRAELRERALLIDVLDRGPGVDERELPRLFESFHRGVESHGVRGAGLGLAVGRAIAGLHGGSLHARRRQGGGSRFRLSLPLVDVPSAPDDEGA